MKLKGEVIGRAAEVLTTEALEFVASLQREFGERRLELLRLRVVRALQSGEFAEIYLESTGETVSLEDYEEAYR